MAAISSAFDSNARALDLEGTIRAADVESTLARARKAFRAVGISRLANVTGLDHVGVPTWIAVRPLARSLTVSQGKGLTHSLAQASAAMESIELHHAEHFVPRGHVASVGAAARDARYADPLLLPIRPDADFHEDTFAEWIAGTDILASEPRWVPRECIDLDSVSSSDGSGVFISSSNGLASGNTREEAALHALCEVIERDQTSFWMAQQQFDSDAPRTRLRLDDNVDEQSGGLIGKCAVAGVRLAVWRVNRTSHVPCFMCTVFDAGGRTLFPQRAAGFGCHPYRRIALTRAITEALQSRLSCIAGARDDVTWATYRTALRVDNSEGARWLARIDNEAETLRFDHIPQAPPLRSIDELLVWVLNALACDGLEQAIIVDLTQEGLDIPVVHATVPGLEGRLGKPGYTPGPRMQRYLARHLDV
jgi:YcaO-like protein with predicted kinase domain